MQTKTFECPLNKADSESEQDQYQNNNATIYVASINSVAFIHTYSTRQYFNSMISYQFLCNISCNIQVLIILLTIVTDRNSIHTCPYMYIYS